MLFYSSCFAQYMIDSNISFNTSLKPSTHIKILLFPDSIIAVKTWVTLTSWDGKYWGVNKSNSMVNLGTVYDTCINETDEIRNYKNQYSKKFGKYLHADSIDRVNMENQLKIDSIRNKEWIKEQSIIDAKKAKSRNLLKTYKANGLPIGFYYADLTTNVIGNPEVNLTVMNISKKTIDATEVEIYCYNRFGEPVKKYSTGSNICTGISQTLIVTCDPNAEFSDDNFCNQTMTWTLYGQELTTNVKIYLKRVHFEDGTNWINPNKQIMKIEAKLP